MKKHMLKYISLIRDRCVPPPFAALQVARPGAGSFDISSQPGGDLP